MCWIGYTCNVHIYGEYEVHTPYSMLYSPSYTPYCGLNIVLVTVQNTSISLRVVLTPPAKVEPAFPPLDGGVHAAIFALRCQGFDW